MSSQEVPGQPPISTDGQPSAPSRFVRLMSLDALRGFDMFWIIGGDELVKAIAKARDNTVTHELGKQMDHVDWQGFHFEDLIFPMFVFIVGASLVFSLSRLIETEGRRVAVGRIIRRALLLYLLGIFYYGGFATPYDRIRLLGVLQRIAICYLFAGLIFCYFGTRGRLLWCVGLLVGYWLVMTFVKVPDDTAVSFAEGQKVAEHNEVKAPRESTGNFAEGHNLANWIDKHYLPLRKWDGNHDPEGLFSTLPAIANCLIGVFAGMLLRDPRRSNAAKVGYMLLAGLVLAGLGWGWDQQFPVVKKIWTSSFVLVACGYSLLFLAFFHLVIECWNLRLWARPFVWIGMNPITLYMIDNLVDMDKIASRFVGGDLNKLFQPFGQAVVAAVGMLIMLAIARFLYTRKIFLRL